MSDLDQGATAAVSHVIGHPALERVARAICLHAGDDPDALAYPPMAHVSAKKPYVLYVPTSEWHKPLPCWNWYTAEAKAAIDAMESVDPARA